MKELKPGDRIAVYNVAHFIEGVLTQQRDTATVQRVAGCGVLYYVDGTGPGMLQAAHRRQCVPLRKKNPNRTDEEGAK